MAPLSARGQFATLLDTTSRFAGNSTGTGGYNQDAGVATATTLNVPSYIVFDSLGNLYISDTQNNCVRKVDTSGNVSTVAGLRVSGSASDTCNTAANPGPNPAEGLLAAHRPGHRQLQHPLHRGQPAQLRAQPGQRSG